MFATADRAFTRFGQSISFNKNKTALFARGRRYKYLRMFLSHHQTDMLEIFENICFRDPDFSGYFPGGKFSLFQQIKYLMADGFPFSSGDKRLFGFLFHK